MKTLVTQTTTCRFYIKEIKHMRLRSVHQHGNPTRIFLCSNENVAHKVVAMLQDLDAEGLLPNTHLCIEEIPSVIQRYGRTYLNNITLEDFLKIQEELKLHIIAYCLKQME